MAEQPQLPLWDMKTRKIPLDEVQLHPDNPRKGNLKKIKESIQANGFISPIIVQRSTMHVIAGNHRVQAARELGITRVPAIVVDIEDAAALRFMLADNKTADEASYDEAALGKLLAEVLEGGDKDALVGTAYSPKEAEKAIARREWQQQEDADEEDEEEAPAKKAKKKGKGKKPDEGAGGKSAAAQGVSHTPTPKDRAEEIEKLGRRSVVISLPLVKFNEISAALSAARDAHEVLANEELLVIWLQKEGYLPDDFTLFAKDEKKAKKKAKKK